MCSISSICPIHSNGKNLVFAMTIRLIPEFWRNQEIPEKFWKRYEQVKLDLLHNFHSFLILFLILEAILSKPKWNIFF